MELQLLPFEESMKLKELGFDWPCHKAYIKNGVLWDSGYAKNSDLEPVNCTAPTLDLACKWLREVHGVSVEPGFRGHLKNKKRWACVVCKTEGLNFIGEMKEGDSWEEAQLDGLREAIGWLSGNLKNKKEIDLWTEGFCENGNRGTATLHGFFVCENLKQAAIMFRDAMADGHSKSLVDIENMTYWGCRFFDNEKDARASFG